MAQREVVVTSGVRTAIGDYGGSLKDVAPTALGAICVREAVSRAKIDPASVGHVVFGSVIHGEAKDMYFSRVAATELGAICVREAVSRAKIDPASVGHVVFGSVIHGEAKDMYFSRVAAT